MDDLLLFTPSKETHMSKLEDLLKALMKNRLKISPKKCQLFKTSLQYMGNEIFIENKKVCVQPLRNRLEAIQKLQPLKTPKGCRSFEGVVNFLSIFCPELQKLLKPIHDLTRKERPFNWGKEQQDSFEEIKSKQQTIKQNTQEINPNPNINFDFKENSPFQEGIMLETFQRQDKSFFQNPKELGDLICKGNLVYKFLPKQTDIDKILKVIQRKVLKGTHFPVEVKEIQVRYLCSPYFKDLYLYILQNRLPSSKSAIRDIVHMKNWLQVNTTIHYSGCFTQMP